MNSITQTSENTVLRMPRRWHVILSWVAVAIMAGVIFWMSAKDGITLDENSGIVSILKAWLASVAQDAFGHPVDVSPVGHFVEYLIFGGLLTNALRWHMSLRRAALLAIALASAYGVTDEIHQIFVPMRSCDLLDWAVDTVAGAAGALIACAILRPKNVSKKAKNAPL